MRRVRVVHVSPAGAAEGCDLLILLLLFCGSEPARESGLTRPSELNPCGSWLASDGGLRADQSLTECTQPKCRSEPARDGDLTADQSLADVPGLILGASALAKKRSIAICVSLNDMQFYAI